MKKKVLFLLAIFFCVAAFLVACVINRQPDPDPAGSIPMSTVESIPEESEEPEFADPLASEEKTLQTESESSTSIDSSGGTSKQKGASAQEKAKEDSQKEPEKPKDTELPKLPESTEKPAEQWLGQYQVLEIRNDTGSFTLWVWPIGTYNDKSNVIPMRIMFGLKSGKTFTFSTQSDVKVFSNWQSSMDLTKNSISGAGTLDGYITTEVTKPIDPVILPDGYDVTPKAPLFLYVGGVEYLISWNGSKLVAQ